MRLTKEQWKQAEYDYIVNSLTYEKIKNKYNISMQSICNMAKTLQWAEKQEIYTNKKKEKHDKKIKEKLINNDNKLNLFNINVTYLLI